MSGAQIRAAPGLGAQRAPEGESLNACHECGRPCRRTFCRAGCRLDWNNRRMSRGAALHDMAMLYRRHRRPGDFGRLWRMVDAWIAEDRAAGRTHYLEPAPALTGYRGVA